MRDQQDIRVLSDNQHGRRRTSWLTRYIRERLIKLEALFARGSTAGERAAAGAAMERLQARLDVAPDQPDEPEIELQYSLPDVWAVRLLGSAAGRC